MMAIRPGVNQFCSFGGFRDTVLMSCTMFRNEVKLSVEVGMWLQPFLARIVMSTKRSIGRTNKLHGIFHEDHIYAVSHCGGHKECMLMME